MKVSMALIVVGLNMTLALAQVPSPILVRVTDWVNPRRDSVARLELREWDKGNITRHSQYDAFFEGQDQLLLQATYPNNEAGRMVLLTKGQLLVQLPTARKPLTLPLQERWMSDAAFADMARANFGADYRIVRKSVENNSSGKVLHLYLEGETGRTYYRHVELRVNSASGRPLSVTFVGTSSRERRTLHYEALENAVGQIRPTRFVFDDSTRPNWKAELTFHEWKPARLSAKFFSPAFLGKGQLASQTSSVRKSDMILPSVASGGPKTHDMVFVAQGNFTMGRDGGFPDERPAHVLGLGSYWIDRYEISVGEYMRFVRKFGGKYRPEPPYSASMPADYFTDRQFAEYPVTGVSWKDASDFCRSAGKRLPTEAEWEKAARGADSRLFPWGNEWDGGAANSAESNKRGQSLPVQIGSFATGASPYGALDMAGNVAEWVSDWYRPYTDDEGGSPSGEYRVIRGGSWVNRALSLSTVARDFADPRYGYDSIGFRCVKPD